MGRQQLPHTTPRSELALSPGSARVPLAGCPRGCATPGTLQVYRSRRLSACSSPAQASRYISGTTSRDHESCPASGPTPGASAVHFRPSGLDPYGPRARSVLARMRRYRPAGPGIHVTLPRGVAALNPRVRGSSPWRRTRTDLGFYHSRSLFLILCGAGLRPS